MFATQCAEDAIILLVVVIATLTVVHEMSTDWAVKTGCGSHIVAILVLSCCTNGTIGSLGGELFPTAAKLAIVQPIVFAFCIGSVGEVLTGRAVKACRSVKIRLVLAS